MTAEAARAETRLLSRQPGLATVPRHAAHCDDSLWLTGTGGRGHCAKNAAAPHCRTTDANGFNKKQSRGQRELDVKLPEGMPSYDGETGLGGEEREASILALGNNSLLGRVRPAAPLLWELHALSYVLRCVVAGARATQASRLADYFPAHGAHRGTGNPHATSRAKLRRNPDEACSRRAAPHRTLLRSTYGPLDTKQKEVCAPVPDSHRPPQAMGGRRATASKRKPPASAGGAGRHPAGGPAAAAAAGLDN